MPTPKGSPSPNPRGRPRGSKTKKSVLDEATMAQLVLDKKTPLDFLLSVMNSESKNVSMSFKIDCAKAAAPFVHKRMPSDVNLGGGVGVAHSGGVMIVPAEPGLNDWAKQSAAAQAQLKEDVKK